MVFSMGFLWFPMVSYGFPTGFPTVHHSPHQNFDFAPCVPRCGQSCRTRLQARWGRRLCSPLGYIIYPGIYPKTIMYIYIYYVFTVQIYIYIYMYINCEYDIQSYIYMYLDVFHMLHISSYIYKCFVGCIYGFIGLLPEKLLNLLNPPNASSEGTWIHRGPYIVMLSISWHIIANLNIKFVCMCIYIYDISISIDSVYKFSVYHPGKTWVYNKSTKLCRSYTVYEYIYIYIYR